MNAPSKKYYLILGIGFIKDVQNPISKLGNSSSRDLR